MAETITFEDGVIRLDGEEIPGILRSLSVDSRVRFDDQKVDGLSGMSKTPQGFEDSDISASLYLINDDESSCYDKLEKLSGIFRAVDGAANPKIYGVDSRHISLCGIRQVVFSKLSTTENDKSDEIVATLGFVEHRPPIVQKEEAIAGVSSSSLGGLIRKVVKAATGKDVGATASAAGPVADSLIVDVD